MHEQILSFIMAAGTIVLGVSIFGAALLVLDIILGAVIHWVRWILCLDR